MTAYHLGEKTYQGQAMDCVRVLHQPVQLLKEGEEPWVQFSDPPPTPPVLTFSEVVRCPRRRGGGGGGGGGGGVGWGRGGWGEGGWAGGTRPGLWVFISDQTTVSAATPR